MYALLDFRKAAELFLQLLCQLRKHPLCLYRCFVIYVSVLIQQDTELFKFLREVFTWLFDASLVIVKLTGAIFLSQRIPFLFGSFQIAFCDVVPEFKHFSHCKHILFLEFESSSQISFDKLGLSL